MIDPILITYMNEMLKHTPEKFHRYMYEEIDWNARMVGLTGPRGVGKSTMALQHLKAHDPEAALYIAADHTYFSMHTLIEVADEFVKEGGKRLYIDEVHKYKGWSRELKQIYDVHPDLKIFFTGSSVLDIHGGLADLSRRVLMYHMQGLSFREYLQFFHGIESKPWTIDEIVENKATLPIEHPLPLFHKYLNEGYYPFAIEGGLDRRINQIVNQTVEVDIPQYADMKASTIRKLKRMLAIISQLAPFKPSAENLAAEIGVSKNNIPDYFVWLEKAGMVAQLRDETGGLRNLGKVEKVFIDNPTLMTVLAGGNPNIGNLRETFFLNQVRVKNPVIASKTSDFVIGDKTFEIGGKNKGFKQLENSPNGIVVKDDIEYGHERIVPLWAFGLNY